MRIFEFLEDHKKKLSDTRLKTLMSALLAFVICGVTAFNDNVTFDETMWVILILLGYSFGQKSFQNITENMGRGRIRDDKG